MIEEARDGLPLGRFAILTAAGIGLAAALLVAAFLLSRSSPPVAQAPVAKDAPPAPMESRIQIHDAGPAWVFVRELWEQTCPSAECGGVNRIYYGQKVDVYQVHEGWARITERYHALCEGGVSPSVRFGNNRCNNLNGFSADSRVANWVPADSLTGQRPPDLGAHVSEDAKFLAGSDDIDLYERQFLAGAKEMVRQGLCTEAEIASSGGYLRSVNSDRKSVYFTICGDKRPYLDVSTGRVSRNL